MCVGGALKADAYILYTPTCTESGSVGEHTCTKSHSLTVIEMRYVECASQQLRQYAIA